jgi:hypothetical protein
MGKQPRRRKLERERKKSEESRRQRRMLWLRLWDCLFRTET